MSHETSRVIPPDYRLVYADAQCAIYHHTTRHVSLRYVGKKAKPTEWYSYTDPEVQKERDAQFTEKWRAYAAQKEADRIKRTQPHSLKIGDVLCASWGWEQTNVDYYQVIAMKGKNTIVLREIACESHEATGWASDTVTPRKDAFISEPFERRTNYTNSVKISSCAHANLDDGKPRHRSWYG